jgi:hypothetical protein
MFPAIQAAPSFSVAFPSIFGRGEIKRYGGAGSETNLSGIGSGGIVASKGVDTDIIIRDVVCKDGVVRQEYGVEIVQASGVQMKR